MDDHQKKLTKVVVTAGALNSAKMFLWVHRWLAVMWRVE